MDVETLKECLALFKSMCDLNLEDKIPQSAEAKLKIQASTIQVLSGLRENLDADEDNNHHAIVALVPLPPVILLQLESPLLGFPIELPGEALSAHSSSKAKCGI